MRATLLLFYGMTSLSLGAGLGRHVSAREAPSEARPPLVCAAPERIIPLRQEGVCAFGETRWTAEVCVKPERLEAPVAVARPHR